ncbi:unnamed protein product, partial [Brugia pahangi]|uniref:CRAL-TRIO domain-containing protein n=1 Tax=Brugia pahangi TaxID=6280 RepID=A0A0N4TT14_BRUPA
VNESTRETFDSDLCKKYKRQSLFIESNDEWKFIKKLITEASFEFIAEMKVNNTVGLKVLLDGVERFGKINPKLIYDKYLKDYQIHRDNNAPCKRYAIVAHWPELSGSNCIVRFHAYFYPSLNLSIFLLLKSKLLHLKLVIFHGNKEITRRLKAMKFVDRKLPNGIVSISVQSISCTELKNHIWHVICKRHCFPYLEETTITTRDFTVYGRGIIN